MDEIIALQLLHILSMDGNTFIFFQLICSQHAAALTIFFQILITQSCLLLCALKKV